jgi:hypothetical protein
VFMLSPEQKMVQCQEIVATNVPTLTVTLPTVRLFLFLWVRGWLVCDSYGRWQSSVGSSQDVLYLCFCRYCRHWY